MVGLKLITSISFVFALHLFGLHLLRGKIDRLIDMNTSAENDQE